MVEASADARPRDHFISLANTVCLMVGRSWSTFLLVTTTIGTRICFSGVLALQCLNSASPERSPIR